MSIWKPLTKEKVRWLDHIYNPACKIRHMLYNIFSDPTCCFSIPLFNSIYRGFLRLRCDGSSYFHRQVSRRLFTVSQFEGSFFFSFFLSFFLSFSPLTFPRIMSETSFNYNIRGKNYNFFFLK